MNVRARVLVFGKNGQVGSNLVRVLGSIPEFEVIGVDIEEIDLTRIEIIGSYIIKTSPNWVINASGHTAVDRAESEVPLSFKLNAAAPQAMARACASIDARFIHYSTDYVFDGMATEPYTETDSPNPQSVYGRSKVCGENGVFTELPDAIIFRTAWVYAKQGNNFVNTMLRLAKQRSELTVVSDQFGSPTLADDLAEITVNIVSGVVSGAFPYRSGIYHATGQGHTSWYEFCEAIMEVTGNTQVTVIPVPASEYPTEAHRPGYSVLSNQKLLDTYQQKLPHWREALNRCLDEN